MPEGARGAEDRRTLRDVEKVKEQPEACVVIRPQRADQSDERANFECGKQAAVKQPSDAQAHEFRRGAHRTPDARHRHQEIADRHGGE